MLWSQNKHTVNSSIVAYTFFLLNQQLGVVVHRGGFRAMLAAAVAVLAVCQEAENVLQAHGLDIWPLFNVAVAGRDRSRGPFLNVKKKKLAKAKEEIGV